MEYNFKETEQKWQKFWKENGTYKVDIDPAKPKFYVLDMFPYPSGAGLHVGHPLGYIASDIYSRYKRLKGFNVLHPMGFDAYGLPAEQYVNQAGISANLVLVGNGAILLGTFNLIFFPRYFKKPDKIGVPFVIGAIVVFFVIGIFIILRWVTPLYSTTLNGLNSENTGAKSAALAIGIVIYAVLSAVSCKLSMKNFQRVDL